MTRMTTAARTFTEGDGIEEEEEEKVKTKTKDEDVSGEMVNNCRDQCLMDMASVHQRYLLRLIGQLVEAMMLVWSRGGADLG